MKTTRLCKEIIYFEDILFEVSFEYYPEEKMVRYYKDGSGYPGSPASIEIVDVTHKETSFLDFFEVLNLMSKIEDKVWDAMNNSFDYSDDI